MFRLATPYALLLLALIPLLVWYRHRRRPPALAAAETRLAAELNSSPALRLHWLLPAMYYLTIVLLIARLGPAPVGHGASAHRNRGHQHRADRGLVGQHGGRGFQLPGPAL